MGTHPNPPPLFQQRLENLLLHLTGRSRIVTAMDVFRYFDAVESLSRTGTVLAECVRRVSSLRGSLSELERETPEALLSACDGATSAIAAVKVVSTRTAALQIALQVRERAIPAIHIFRGWGRRWCKCGLRSRPLSSCT